MDRDPRRATLTADAMLKLRALWFDFQSSLWFVPTLIVGASMGLALGLIELDARFERELLAELWPRLFGAGAEGSRDLLSVIAGSMITVAGVTFSITVVALTLASSQYTSRILRNFMMDRANQTVLGVFLGVYSYCLVVLRTIRSGDEGSFVPTLAVFVAQLLALVAIGFLIFFIHHIATSIQATSIIESAAVETLESLDRSFPEELEPGEAEPEEDALPASLAMASWRAIPAGRTGYIQAIDRAALTELAGVRHLQVRVERGIGEFVIEGCPLVSIAGPEAEDSTARHVNAAFTVGRHRTIYQDAAYGIRQIVDVALKALSPGVNDTTTAVICVDFLGAILARLADRRLARPTAIDGEEGRLILRGTRYAALVGEALDQIRQNASGNVAVLLRLLETLETLALRTRAPGRRQVLRQQADWVLEAAERSVPAAHDLEMLRLARARVLPVAGLSATPVH